MLNSQTLEQQLIATLDDGRLSKQENRSLHRVNEDLSTELTPLPRKKCIFRAALKLERSILHLSTD